MSDGESYYDRLGGAEGVRRLVDLFYDEMEDLPEARGIRALHKDDLTESRDKLYEFFSGWFGGPPLFVEKYGHPMLRARHLHVPIGASERDAWLMCLARAMYGMDLDEGLIREMLEKIVPMADHMRNVAPPTSEAPE